MKTATTLGMAALLVTAGAALADQPVVLTDGQLDRITAGLPSDLERVSLNFGQIKSVVQGGITVTFAEGDLDSILIGLSHPAGSVEHTLPGAGKR